MRFVSRFVSRIRACVGVRARIGARVGVGWGAMAPVLLSAGACPGFYVYTAYTNTFTTYRLLLIAYSNRFTIYRSRRRDAFTSHELLPKRLLLPPTQKRLRLSLTLRCFLLPIGFSVIISFGAVGKSDYFLVLRPPLPFLALFLLCASFTSFPEAVWDLSIPLPFGASLLALFKAARYFLRSGVEWYFLLYAFFFLRASGFCLKYSDEFIEVVVVCYSPLFAYFYAWAGGCCLYLFGGEGFSGEAHVFKHQPVIRLHRYLAVV